MPQDCPQIREAAEGREPGGVKRPAGAGRSPSPGGIAERPGKCQLSCELGQGVSEAGGGLIGRCETRESGGGFAPQGTDGEMIIPQDCPELPWGKAEGSRLNAKVRNDEECIVLIGGVGEDTVVGLRGNLTLHLLTGLTGFFDGKTWACARRTRSNPGFHMRGLQPRWRSSAIHPIRLGRSEEETPE